MIGILAQNWWALALRGVIAVLFGIAAFMLPGPTLAWLLILFAAYLFVDGILTLIASLRAARRHDRFGMLALEGVVDLLIAVQIVLWPGPTLLLFIYIAAFWAILSGIALLVAAIRLHNRHGEWLMIPAGVLSIVWGVLIVLFPIAGIVIWAWWLGAYALVFGVSMLVLAFRLKRTHSSPA
jgi:uncharacterized membrane protein HdeD (DUF308 family)